MTADEDVPPGIVGLLMKPRWGTRSWMTPVSQGSRCAATLGYAMGRFQRRAKAAAHEMFPQISASPPKFVHQALVRTST